MALKSNGTHQLLVYADDVNLLGDNIDTREKNAISNASKEAGIEINGEKVCVAPSSPDYRAES
jgi:hypothetical protein